MPNVASVGDAKNKRCSKQRRNREANKEKIPQKLIENRRQEIISSLVSVTSDEEVVITGIPRVYTGSKRGSNFRGVSVNGKKWQVSTLIKPISNFTTYDETI